ncbi:MAG: aminoacyl-tRNA deacylase [Candidatus Limnocylindrales bacterium]
MRSQETAALAGPHQGLLDWLGAERVEYEVHEHTATSTALETAHAEHIDPHTFAKVVVVTGGDGRRAMFVLEATDHVDLVKARHVLDSGHVSLLTEVELLGLCPDCQVGTLPAVGALWDLPMYADHALREDSEITFNAGSHRFCVRVERAAWERATHVRYGDLAEDLDRRPAWARS